jgi:hypothetical protein
MILDLGFLLRMFNACEKNTMKNALILAALLSVSINGFSQAKSPASRKGYAKVTKVTPDKSMPSDEARIIFTFVGADNRPACKLVKVVCNYDSAFPNISAAGNYTVGFDPGKYKMRFSVPYWHTIKTDSILLKKQTVTTLMVKFEAEEISGKH